MKNKDINNNLKNDFDIKIPDNWDKIKESLPEAGLATSPAPKNEKHFSVGYRWVTAAVAVLLIVTIVTVSVINNAGTRPALTPTDTDTMPVLNSNTAAKQNSTPSPKPTKPPYVELNFSEQTTQNINKFSFDMMKLVYEKGENAALSPISMYYLLGMLANGAEGETRAEILKAVGAADNMEDFNKQANTFMYGYLSYLKDDGESGSKTNISNSMWIAEQTKDYVKESYKELLLRSYNAETNYVNFLNRKEAADRMNGWISDKTEGLIKDLIDENAIAGGDTRLFLINTIYFKCGWKEAFTEKLTSVSKFNAPTGTVNVDMMNHLFDSLNFIKNDEVSGVVLDYRDCDASMVILMPEEEIGAYMDKMTGDKFDGIFSAMKKNHGSVQVGLPKFNVRQKSDMNKVLETMGISKMFSGAEADFSNMSDYAKANGLCVSKVNHETYIKTDEEGTVAAGASSAEMVDEGMPAMPKEITFDKPFLAAIVDRPSGTVFFMTVVENPAGYGS